MSGKHNDKLKRLCLVASDDQTRPALNQVYKDKEHNCLVATDGHRMIRDNKHYDLVDTSFSASVYLKTGHIYPIDDKFPNISTFYEPLKSYKYNMTLTLHEGIRVISKFKKAFNGYFKSDGQLTITPCDDACFSLDLRLLDILAGEQVTIYFNDNKTAVRVIPVNDQTIDLVVMPLRIETTYYNKKSES